MRRASLMLSLANPRVLAPPLVASPVPAMAGGTMRPGSSPTISPPIMRERKCNQIELWLTASRGGRALLFLGALTRSRRNLRWHLRGAARNLLSFCRRKPGPRGSASRRET